MDSPEDGRPPGGDSPNAAVGGLSPSFREDVVLGRRVTRKKVRLSGAKRYQVVIRSSPGTGKVVLPCRAVLVVDDKDARGASVHRETAVIDGLEMHGKHLSVEQVFDVPAVALGGDVHVEFELGPVAGFRRMQAEVSVLQLPDAPQLGDPFNVRRICHLRASSRHLEDDDLEDASVLPITNEYCGPDDAHGQPHASALSSSLPASLPSMAAPRADESKATTGDQSAQPIRGLLGWAAQFRERRRQYASACASSSTSPTAVTSTKSSAGKNPEDNTVVLKAPPHPRLWGWGRTKRAAPSEDECVPGPVSSSSSSSSSSGRPRLQAAAAAFTSPKPGAFDEGDAPPPMQAAASCSSAGDDPPLKAACAARRVVFREIEEGEVEHGEDAARPRLSSDLGPVASSRSPHGTASLSPPQLSPPHLPDLCLDATPREQQQQQQQQQQQTTTPSTAYRRSPWRREKKEESSRFEGSAAHPRAGGHLPLSSAAPSADRGSCAPQCAAADDAASRHAKTADAATHEHDSPPGAQAAARAATLQGDADAAEVCWKEQRRVPGGGLKGAVVLGLPGRCVSRMCVCVCVCVCVCMSARAVCLTHVHSHPSAHVNAARTTMCES